MNFSHSSSYGEMPVLKGRASVSYLALPESYDLHVITPGHTYSSFPAQRWKWRMKPARPFPSPPLSVRAFSRPAPPPAHQVRTGCELGGRASSCLSLPLHVVVLGVGGWLTRQRHRSGEGCDTVPWPSVSR